MADVDLTDPVELRVRGERMELVGLLSAVTVLLHDHADVVDGVVAGRAEKTISSIMDEVKRQENIELVRRELETAHKRGDVVEYRGVDVVYRDFDPKHPDLDELEHPPLDEVEAYALLGTTDGQMFADMWPPQAEVDIGLSLASWLRMFAREIERSYVDASQLERGDDNDDVDEEAIGRA